MAPVWLTAAELADRLKVAQSTLWQWNLRGYGPPAVRIGGKLRYRVRPSSGGSASRSPWAVPDNGGGRAPRPGLDAQDTADQSESIIIVADEAGARAMTSSNARKE